MKWIFLNENEIYLMWTRKFVSLITLKETVCCSVKCFSLRQIITGLINSIRWRSARTFDIMGIENLQATERAYGSAPSFNDSCFVQQAFPDLETTQDNFAW